MSLASQINLLATRIGQEVKALRSSSVPSITMTIPGTLVTGTGVVRFYFNATRTVSNVVVGVGTAPTGSTIIVDVNKNGTTIFTTQGNRPTIAISGFSDLTSVPDVTGFVSGDYLTVDVDQKGSTIAGADLVVTVYFT